MSTQHDPYVQSWHQTQESPAEVYVTCSCGRWEFGSQESAGGPVEDWRPFFDAHVEEAEQRAQEAREPAPIYVEALTEARRRTRRNSPERARVEAMHRTTKPKEGQR